MTKTLNINEMSIQTVITSAKNGDEIVLEENGKPIAKITPIANGEQTLQKPRILGIDIFVKEITNFAHGLNCE